MCGPHPHTQGHPGEGTGCVLRVYKVAEGVEISPATSCSDYIHSELPSCAASDTGEFVVPSMVKNVEGTARDSQPL